MPPTTLKLTYFPVHVRAFAIRAALRHAQIPFEDVRIRGKALGELRGGPTGFNARVPLGSLPTLEIDGEVYVQSIALSKWAAKQSKDLYPSDALSQLVVDEAMETAGEMIAKMPQSSDEAKRKELREAYLINTLPRYAEYFLRRTHQGNTFVAGGEALTIADLYAFAMFQLMRGGSYDYIPKTHIQERYPKLHNYLTKVENHPIAHNELSHPSSKL